jgi:hypothetical protein
MTKPTDEQIAKLPAWAREHINSLSRQREQAVKTLNEFCDTQTPTQFYIEDNPYTGENHGQAHKRHYIKAYSINVQWRNVWLRIAANDFGNLGEGIHLQWGGGDDKQYSTEEVAFIPDSHQSARIVHKDDMR